MPSLKLLKFEDLIENPDDIDAIVKNDEQFKKDSIIFKDRVINTVGRFDVSKNDPEATKYSYVLTRKEIDKGKKLWVEDIMYTPKYALRKTFSIAVFPLTDEIKNQASSTNVIFNYGLYKGEYDKNDGDESRRYGFSNGEFISELNISVENIYPFLYDKEASSSLEEFMSKNKFTIIHRTSYLNYMVLEYIIYENNLYVMVKKIFNVATQECKYYQLKCPLANVKKYSFNYLDSILFVGKNYEINGMEIMTDEEKVEVKKLVHNMTNIIY